MTTVSPRTSNGVLGSAQGAVAVEPVLAGVAPVGAEAVRGAAAAATVVVLCVTWNRREMVSNMVRALAGQTFPRERMHVVVIDNCSTDGTTQALAEAWHAERVVENPTQAAHEPAFQPGTRPPHAGSAEGTPNSAGFGSLTIIRNGANMGGCGGFNTGLGFVEEGQQQGVFGEPDFVWLVDDDADLPPDALERLVSAAGTDPEIGLVGSRTVNIADRRTTIETTIYLDRKKGAMCDEPPAHHRLHESHRRWVETVGGTRGERSYSGLRDVDVVSACSMLARWSAVVGQRGGESVGKPAVGFWDWRYFIYCDDADWCLRFAKAGWRVVLNLDAVVYHTPWNLKLTPARIYYAQRNAVWMLQKVLPGRELRRVTRRWMRIILQDSLRAGLMRRLFHADIIRRTAHDIAVGRGGKTGSDGPPTEEVVGALRRIGAVGGGKRRRVAVVCCGAESLSWSADLRRRVAAEAKGVAVAEPRWVEIVRNDVVGVDGPADQGVERVVYGHRWRSRLRRQVDVLRKRPHAVVVFDQTCDFPAVAGKWNVHIDLKKPGLAQVERDGPVGRLGFLARWAWSAAVCAAFAIRVRPYTSATRYG